MSKQEHLISELIEYLERKITENKESIEDGAEPDYVNSLYGRIEGMDIAIEKIKELFDPVTTIKPGDKVNHHGEHLPFLKGVKVSYLMVTESATLAVLSYRGQSYPVTLDSLEVVKDE
ncbi:hypothetical protein [Paenibacillus sp. Marseille-Q4541]|uniref:hypothetical protein n=1 Tax=Paenibacillus sp. Marseille-Q4541 TaxID=2831522 RepID=UPI001BABDEE8|nr:hypothetical protein [Paenibacillus sp. Marseille-Q4541]